MKNQQFVLSMPREQLNDVAQVLVTFALGINSPLPSKEANEKTRAGQTLYMKQRFKWHSMGNGEPKGLGILTTGCREYDVRTIHIP
ncbi:hypothetical protein FPOAC1_003279 [Fusarium poae]|uniref:hypothetical protein n=1 Tax=Fusarium poae TaxID=36050 RepID=UPI001CE84ED4|nr:hypothetical protein FPOAC1_003279 [Fusarium poae]KAG8677265.1 hypothetical protein FPOAC1_003279 [Fusarium poae]